MNARGFFACHPAVNFLYFLLVLSFSMLFFHPLFLAVSLLSALLCATSLLGSAAVRRTAKYLLPAALLAALVNVAFSHEGATILAYLPSGNPLTLESAAYGLAAAAMLSALLIWCACWSAVMTADKLMYLLGRLSPSLSLVLSMTLRFAPRFRAKFREVTAVRRGMGLYTERTRFQTLKSTVTVFSVMLTWSLEHAAETADSMKSRGWGVGRRTAFSPFRLDRRDRHLLVLFTLCGAALIAGKLSGALSWRYYPTLRFPLTPAALALLPVYLILCLTPVLLQRKEERAWSSAAPNI